MKIVAFFASIALLFATPLKAADLEDRIWVGCLNNAEVVFYLAQEKLYGELSEEKLEAELKKQFSEGEAEVILSNTKLNLLWVQANNYPTAKEYAIAALGQCLSTNYKHFDLETTEKTNIYTKRFEHFLDWLPERPADAEIKF